MANWLEHPHELGQLPDSLEIVDQREIYWPPREHRTHIAIVKWTQGEDRCVGTTGGTTTWCFFSTEELEEAPFDIYARHCNWQMQSAEMDCAPESYNELDYGKELLRKSNPHEDWSARP